MKASLLLSMSPLSAARCTMRLKACRSLAGSVNAESTDLQDSGTNHAGRIWTHTPQQPVYTPRQATLLHSHSHIRPSQPQRSAPYVHRTLQKHACMHSTLTGKLASEHIHRLPHLYCRSCSSAGLAATLLSTAAGGSTSITCATALPDCRSGSTMEKNTPDGWCCSRAGLSALSAGVRQQTAAGQGQGCVGTVGTHAEVCMPSSSGGWLQ